MSLSSRSRLSLFIDSQEGSKDFAEVLYNWLLPLNGGLCEASKGGELPNTPSGMSRAGLLGSLPDSPDILQVKTF